MTNQLTAIMARTATLQKVNQRLPTIISLILVVACAHALAKITWMFVPQEDAPMVTTTQPVAPVNTAALRQQAIRQLTSAHLFGVADQPAAAKQTSAPKTKLNLVLRGVVAAEPMEMSFAIIARGKNGKEEAFGVGDKIPGGVTIEEIHTDRIILSRNGRLETLFMVKDEDVATVRSSKRTTSSSLAGKPRGLADVRRSILKNPTSFGDYAIPVIVKENGKQVGYRLQPQSMGEELMAQIGMNATDVITEVNGVRLDKPQNGIAALRKLSNATSVTLKVKRNGAEVPLNIQLQ